MAAPANNLLLHCRVVEGRDLAAADPNGYSDPYVKLKLHGQDGSSKEQKERSHVLNHTVNPVWNWDTTLHVGSQLSGEVSLEVGDSDELVSNDFLGFIRLKLADLLFKKVSGGWFRLRDKKGDKHFHGRVFVVFAVDATAGPKGKRDPTERDSILFHATQQVVHSMDHASDVPLHLDPASALAALTLSPSAAATPAAAPFPFTTASSSSSPSAASAAATTEVAGLPLASPGALLPVVSQLSVFVGTWNVGNEPPQEDLSSWLFPAQLHGNGDGGGLHGPRAPGHDLYAIGVQECKYDVGDAAASSSVVDHLRTTSAHFQAVLERNLNQRNINNNGGGGGGGGSGSGASEDEDEGEYVLLKLEELMEIRLFIFVRRGLAERVDGVVSGVEATGLGGVLGNKGGVAITLRFDDTSMTFLTAHLAAHQDRCGKRNEDVRDILANTKLNRRNLDVLASSRLQFFSGDLNYRLNFGDQGDAHSPTPEQFEAVVSKIRSGRQQDLAELFATDQLDAARKAGAVLAVEHGWQEGDCTSFEPTFKVSREPGTVYKMQRSPAWCDRVLWRVGQVPASQSALRIQCNPRLRGYGSAPPVGSSDHKPVWASFGVPLLRMPLATDYTRGALSIRFSRLELRELGSYSQPRPPNALVKFYSPMLVNSQETKMKHIRWPDSGAHSPTSNKVAPAEDLAVAAAAGSSGSGFGALSWSGSVQSGGGGEIPLLSSFVNNPARLSTQPLFLKVLTEAEVSHIERLLATAEIDLSAQGAFEGKPVEFDVPLLFGGLPAGRARGTFQLEWAPLK